MRGWAVSYAEREGGGAGGGGEGAGNLPSALLENCDKSTGPLLELPGTPNGLQMSIWQLNFFSRKRAYKGGGGPRLGLERTCFEIIGSSFEAARGISPEGSAHGDKGQLFFCAKEGSWRGGTEERIKVSRAKLGARRDRFGERSAGHRSEGPYS